jgi:hypothetical protein
MRCTSSSRCCTPRRMATAASGGRSLLPNQAVCKSSLALNLQAQVAAHISVCDQLCLGAQPVSSVAKVQRLLPAGERETARSWSDHSALVCCRLHNMGAPATSVLGTVFRGADLEAQLNVLARRAGGRLPTTSLADTHKMVWDCGRMSEQVLVAG